MPRNNRKGVELTVNTMILMALALLVLIIGAVIIIRTVGKSNSATSCDAQGGTCYATATACPSDKPVPGWSYSCSDTAKPKCCVDMGLGQK